jgi:hypothetical protein
LTALWRLIETEVKRSPMSSLRSKSWAVCYSLLLVAVGSALAGLAATTVALWFVGAPIAAFYAEFYLAAPIAAALLGPCLWWWVIIRPDRLSVRRGIGVGALSACLAHPLAWYIALVLAFFMGERTLGGVTGGVTVTNPAQDLGASLILAGFSLLYVGWITTLLGGAAGGGIALLQSVSGSARRWRAVLSE